MPKIHKLTKIQKSSMLGGMPGLAMILTKGFCMMQFLLGELYCICHAHTSLRVTQSETEHSTASSEEARWLI